MNIVALTEIIRNWSVSREVAKSVAKIWWLGRWASVCLSLARAV